MGKIVLSALKWALIGGLSVIILQTIFMLISAGMMGGFWGVIVYLPLLFIMIWGGITIRKENGGDIGYPKSLLAVFIIAVVGSLMYNVYVYQIWFKFVDPDFMDKVMEISEEKIRDKADKQGITDEQLEMQISYVKGMNWEKWAYIISGSCSVVLSLIVSVFVSRPDRQEQSIIKEES
ncbi:MAG: DUF4199 domain-containing protein [Bacteroidota bacterium]